MLPAVAFLFSSGFLASHHHARPAPMFVSLPALPPARRLGFLVRWLAVAALAVAAAFSAAQTPAASENKADVVDAPSPASLPTKPAVDIAIVLPLNAAAYARAAQWIVGGLFGILVLLLGVNFVRRRRPTASDTDTDPDADTSADAGADERADHATTPDGTEADRG